MAIAAYASDSPLDRRKWSRYAQWEQNRRVSFLKWGMSAQAKKTMGNPLKDTGLPIAILNELSEGDEGARLRIPWVNRLEGAGKSANDQLEGQEEAIRFGYLDVIIDRLRHATGYEGRMSAIRNKDLHPDTVKDLLLNWLIDQREKSYWDTLFKGASGHLINAGHYVATAHPNTYHYDKETEELGIEGLQNGVHNFDTNVLDRIIERYEDSDNPIPYVEIDGEELGLVVIHTKQAATLRRDSRFMQLQADAFQRYGAPGGKDHPLLQNAKYRYHNLCIYTSPRVYNGAQAGLTGSGYTAQHYGAVLLGPLAIGTANGGFPDEDGMATGKAGLGYDEDGNIATLFVPSDDTDYKNKVKWAIDSIWGDRRADFTMEAGGTKNQSSAIFWTIQ